MQEIQQQKTELRREALRRRRDQDLKDPLSAVICERFMALPEYERAATVLFYLDVRSEVRTRQAIPKALASGKRVVVPYCVDRRLELFRLQSMDELVEGEYGILEPAESLRVLSDRRMAVEALDLVMVPGVAFDLAGGRLGHGEGYFDRLLAHCRPDATRAGLAYECQLFPAIPTLPHDVRMDMIITETAVYAGLGRNREGEAPAEPA